MKINIKENLEFINSPNWGIFMGNNHSKVTGYTNQNGGSFDFESHVGKPLSDKLWEDLFKRLCVSGLRIYYCGDEQWSDGTGPNYMYIYLNADGTVKNMVYNPPIVQWQKEYSTKDLVDALDDLLNKTDDEVKLTNARKICDYWKKVSAPWKVVEEEGIFVINNSLLGI